MSHLFAVVAVWMRWWRSRSWLSTKAEVIPELRSIMERLPARKNVCLSRGLPSFRNVSLWIRAVVLWVLIFAATDSASGKDAQRSVRIGVLARRGAVRCMEKWGATAKHLSDRIPAYTFEIIPLGFEEINTTVERGEVDFVLVNPGIYVELELRYGVSRIATLKNHWLGRTHVAFAGLIFRRADRDDLEYLADLKGKRFMAVAQNSFGGWHMAWREFKENGIDPYRDFGSLEFGGTHDAVVYAVRDGKVDAGTVRNDILERMAAEGQIRIEDFHVMHEHSLTRSEVSFLHSTRPYPEWPFAKVKHTSRALAEKVTVTLLEMSPDSPAARMALCAGWTVPLDYQSVHECLKELRVGPYKDFGKVTFSDVVGTYWPWLVAAALAAMAMAAAVVSLRRMSRRLIRTQSKLKNELEKRERTGEALREARDELESRVEQRTAELERTRRDLARLIETANAPIFGLDIQGRINEWNEMVAQVTGYSRDEALGLDFAEALISEEHKDSVTRFLGAAMRGEEIQNYECSILTKDGRTVFILLNSTIRRDDHGDIVGVMGVGQDITERVRLQEEASEQMGIEKAINRVLRAGLSSADLAAASQVCLEVAMEITSSAFGFVGKLNDQGTFDTTFLADPGWKDCRMPSDQAVVLISGMKIRGIWSEVIRQNETLITNDPSSHPASVGTPEGHPPIRCFLGVPLSRGKQAFGAICVANKPGGYTEKDREYLERLSVAFVMALDHSRAEEELREHHDRLEELIEERSGELKEKAVALEQANVRLQEADRLKSVFIASMSHELRTPLNSIIGFTGIILQGMSGEITSEQRKQLSMVKSSANHLLSLINDVIDVSKIEAGTVELTIDEFDLSELVRGLRDSLTVAIAEKDLALSVEIPESLIIKGDERRTKQVIMNLLSNAIKFTDKGEIGIKIAGKDGAAEVSVRDTGDGIRKEDIKTLFKAFRRFHVEGTPIQEGTGLGLYLSEKIADLLGAQIKVASEPGKGSTFTFTLPLTYEEPQT